MALGIKKIETRGWATNYRGPLVIHAAKTPLSTICRELGEDREYMGNLWCREYVGMPFKEMPLGAILCVVNVVNCVKTEIVEVGDFLGSTEWQLGNYEPGRFAWITDKVRTLAEPIPWKGSQGFFDVPDEVVRQALIGAA